jgi:hypothetical protein
MEQMESKIIKLKKLFFIPDPGKLCRLPYPGHKKGCPNLGKSLLCPPNAPKLIDKYDLSKPCYFIVQPFNISAQKEKMKKLHHDWSDRQCACCLYWQNGVRKELKERSEIECMVIGGRLYANGIIPFSGLVNFELIPEAMGLNVFSTTRYHGIYMVRNPQEILYKIAFVGVLK